MIDRYALPTRCLSSNLKQSLHSASRLQVSGVQLDVRQEIAPDQMGASAIRDFRNRLEELNLKVASGAFPLRQAIYESQSLEKRLEAIRAAMTFCYQLGTDILTVRPGPIPDPEQHPEEWQLLIDVLNELTRFGNHSGVTLCLSLSLEVPERVKSLMESVQEGMLGINYDPLSVLGTSQPQAEIFREYHQVIRHIRARDGIRNIEGEVEEVPLGRGAVDWAELLALLQESDYSGWIVLDRAMGAGADQTRDLQQGLLYLRQLMPF